MHIHVFNVSNYVILINEVMFKLSTFIIYISSWQFVEILMFGRNTRYTCPVGKNNNCNSCIKNCTEHGYNLVQTY